jgi:hypothetical protein
MADQYWAACRATPGREHLVRSEIEKLNHGAILPTYARTWISDGKVSCRETVLMPGYVFFRTEPKGWGAVSNIAGVEGVLSYVTKADDVMAKRVSDVEMARLIVGDFTGDHDCIQTDPTSERRERVRRRRPRPGKRIKKRHRASP